MYQDKLHLLDLLENTFCRIRPSSVSGVGVFAIRDIPANTDLFTGMIDQEWINLPETEISFLPEEVREMIDDFFVVEDGFVSIPKNGLNGMDISFYLNHSEKPNVKTTDGGFTFISIKKINKGEELTVSYRTFDPKNYSYF